MTDYSFLDIAAVILGIIAYTIYVTCIIKRKIRPDMATWIIWTGLGGLLVMSDLVKGDLSTIWLPFSSFLATFIVAILTYRYGFSKWNRIDTICLIVSAFSLVPWMLFRNPTQTMAISIFIEVIGGIPTIYKTYLDPDTEEFPSWFIILIATIFGICSITHWELEDLYFIYLFFFISVIVFLVAKPKIKEIRKIM